MPLEHWSLTETGHGEIGLFLSARTAAGLPPLVALPCGLKARIQVVAGDADLPEQAFSGLVAAIVEVEQGHEASLSRMSRALRDNGNVPLIAALSSPAVGTIKALLREGVSDVLSLPLDLAELEGAVLEIVARRSASARERLCPAVAVVRSHGGSGATTVATNLAAALGHGGETAFSALMVDLDIQFGNAADYLGLERPASIVDLTRSTERLDDALIASTATRLNGFSLIAAPPSVTPFEAMEVDPLLQVLRQLRRTYDGLILDLPANWSNWSLSVVGNADLILLVVELSVRSIAQAKRTMDLFEATGIPKENVRIVLNKVEKHFFASIRPEDVERTLGSTVIGSLPEEEGPVSGAQQQGEPVVAFAPRSRFAKAMAKLAAAVRAALPEAR